MAETAGLYLRSRTVKLSDEADLSLDTGSVAAAPSEGSGWPNDRGPM